MAGSGSSVLDRLYRTIESRKTAAPEAAAMG